MRCPWRSEPRSGTVRGDQEGFATAEFAVVLPAIGAVVLLAVWAVLVVVAQLRCVDAAGAGARALARGEDSAQVVAVVGSMAPRGATVRLGRDGDRVSVEVSATVRFPALWRGAPGAHVGDQASALAEDTASRQGVPP